MRKTFAILFILFSLYSCKISVSSKRPSSCSEFTNKNNVNLIVITQDNGETYEYEKINIDSHMFYFRSWHAKYGNGSDLVHNPNCPCKNN